MNIGLAGYGKMGRTIEQLAINKGHSIGVILNKAEDWNTQKHLFDNIDVFIEFTQPDAAVPNLTRLLKEGHRVITGTTGWLNKYNDVKDICLEHGGALLFASNFSIGMNLLFELNRQLAKWTNDLSEFSIAVEETHHIHKKDSPSGTAVTLLEDITRQNSKYQGWKLTEDQPGPYDIPVTAIREGEVYGIHQVQYTGTHDLLTIRHKALSRDGFASGALLAAEWINGRQGVFTMRDVLHQR